MISGIALQRTTSTLSINNIEDAHLEARILLSHVLQQSPTDLYSKPEYSLSPEQQQKLQELVKRRLQREPSAYLINHKEFFGLDFHVDHSALIPRPETELLVEETLKFVQSHINNLVDLVKPLVIADIGTGCGNIAISLALNSNDTKIYAVDISPSALEVASLNCHTHNVTDQIILLQGNLLEPLTETVDVIVANLPYIPTPELAKLSPEIHNFEPMIALDGGRQGLDHIGQLLRQAKEKIHHSCRILLEIGADQEKSVATLITEHLPNATFEFIPDWNGIKRIIGINI